MSVSKKQIGSLVAVAAALAFILTTSDSSNNEAALRVPSPAYAKVLRQQRDIESRVSYLFTSRDEDVALTSESLEIAAITRQH